MKISEIYDKLRQAHDIVNEIETDDLSEWELMILESIQGVLYMAEKEFANF